MSHRVFAAIRQQGVVIIVVSLLSIGVLAPGARASDASYPEVGAEIPAAKRGKFDKWINCAIDEIPPPYKKQLAHCAGKASSFKIHHFDTTKQPHWKHGTPKAPGGKGWAFGTHPTPEQLKNCQMCIAVDLKLWCTNIDGANGTGPHKAWYEGWVKRLLRHELIHMTQYEVWPLWRVRNKDIFNHPWDGSGWADGKNGNPPATGSASGPTHAADKCARELYDAFDKLRKELTELQAVVFGNTQAGCKKPFNHFEPHTDKKGKTTQPFVDIVMGTLRAAKEELFGDPKDANSTGKVGEIEQKLGNVSQANKPAYAKLQKFLDQIKAQKKKMCEDVDQALADAEKAKTKAKGG